MPGAKRARNQLFIIEILRFSSQFRLLYVGIGIFEQLLEYGVHRITECTTFGLHRLHEGLLEIWGRDVTTDEAVNEIEIRRDVG
jgi:hypothetical protein